MRFPKQKYWSGLPFSSPGDLSQPREWTRVSRIAGRLLSIWASREALATLFVLLPIRADFQDSASPSHTDALWIIQRHCTCAILILDPSSYSFTSHSLSPVSPNAITRSVHPTPPSLRTHHCSLGECPPLPSSGFECQQLLLPCWVS